MADRENLEVEKSLIHQGELAHRQCLEVRELEQAGPLQKSVIGNPDVLQNDLSGVIEVAKPETLRQIAVCDLPILEFDPLDFLDLGLDQFLELG